MLQYMDARAAARQFGAVGEPTRLMILYALAESRQNVGELAELLGVPIVNMVHHLAVLRKHRLVEDEKDGRRVVYRLHPDTFTPPTDEADGLGTLSLGVCRLRLSRGGRVTTDQGIRQGAKAIDNRGRVGLVPIVGGLVAASGDHPEQDGVEKTARPSEDQEPRSGDMGARVEELKSLRDGWLDGQGIAPIPEGLDWFRYEFQRAFPDELPPPYLYPTAEGGVRTEWTIGDFEVSVDYTFGEKAGVWHALNLSTDHEHTAKLDLSSPVGWIDLVALLRSLSRNPSKPESV